MPIKPVASLPTNSNTHIPTIVTTAKIKTSSENSPALPKDIIDINSGASKPQETWKLSIEDFKSKDKFIKSFLRGSQKNQGPIRCSEVLVSSFDRDRKEPVLPLNELLYLINKVKFPDGVKENLIKSLIVNAIRDSNSFNAEIIAGLEPLLQDNNPAIRSRITELFYTLPNIEVKAAMLEPSIGLLKELYYDFTHPNPRKRLDFKELCFDRADPRKEGWPNHKLYIFKKITETFLTNKNWQERLSDILPIIKQIASLEMKISSLYYKVKQQAAKSYKQADELIRSSVDNNTGIKELENNARKLAVLKDNFINNALRVKAFKYLQSAVRTHNVDLGQTGGVAKYLEQAICRKQDNIGTAHIVDLALSSIKTNLNDSLLIKSAATLPYKSGKANDRVISLLAKIQAERNNIPVQVITKLAYMSADRDLSPVIRRQALRVVSDSHLDYQNDQLNIDQLLLNIDSPDQLLSDTSIRIARKSFENGYAASDVAIAEFEQKLVTVFNKLDQTVKDNALCCLGYLVKGNYIPSAKLVNNLKEQDINNFAIADLHILHQIIEHNTLQLPDSFIDKLIIIAKDHNDLRVREYAINLVNTITRASEYLPGEPELSNLEKLLSDEQHFNICHQSAQCITESYKKAKEIISVDLTGKLVLIAAQEHSFLDDIHLVADQLSFNELSLDNLAALLTKLDSGEQKEKISALLKQYATKEELPAHISNLLKQEGLAKKILAKDAVNNSLTSLNEMVLNGEVLSQSAINAVLSILDSDELQNKNVAISIIKTATENEQNLGLVTADKIASLLLADSGNKQLIVTLHALVQKGYSSKEMVPAFEASLDNKDITDKISQEFIVNGVLLLKGRHYQLKESTLITLEEIANQGQSNSNRELPNIDEIALKQKHLLLNSNIEKVFWGESYIDQLKQDVEKLIKNGWQIDFLQQVIVGLNTNDRQSFAKSISIINAYQIKPSAADKNITAESVFYNYKPQLWQENFYNLVLDINSSNSLEKSEEVLFNELQGLNSTKKVLLNQLTDIRRLLAITHNIYDNDSDLHQTGKAIREWDREDITAWGLKAKQNKDVVTDRKFLAEMSAVLKRANAIHTGYELRDIQTISFLTLMTPQSGKGRLLQVITAEGKSTITSMTAAAHALMGKVVDVVTSSPILAKRDIESREDFFTMLSLSSGHNIMAGYYRGTKECYTKDIVYGDAGSFQYDVLKHEYKSYATRGDRVFGTVIIDEVDSMMIDEGSKIAKLATPIPSMEYLEPVLMSAWQQLNLLMSVEEITNRADSHQILVDLLTKHIHSSLTGISLSDSGENIQPILIPRHLKSFAMDQASSWAKSAINAMHMQENKDYVIIDNKKGYQEIAPVDYSNTGIVQESTSWGDGLHQFLQLKHYLKMSAEGLTSSYISNIGYFKRYGDNIYGLTGTLGSESAKELLEEVYGIDTADIPTFKKKQFIELPGIVCSSENDWTNNVSRRAIEEASKGRASLVICETIADVDKVSEQIIKSGYPEKSVRVYSRNDLISEFEASVDSGDIIIATNLAGRGTDIKTTSAVEKRGGMHVVVAFLPSNLRIEEQAFGRTSRQGKSGTGQLVINENYERLKMKAPYQSTIAASSIEDFKDWRNQIEMLRLQEVKDQKLPKILLGDELFDLFNKDIYQKLKQAENNKYKLFQLEELWGLWLKSHMSGEELDRDEILREFALFKNQSISEYNSNKIMRNPAHLVQEGYNQMGVNNGYGESIDLLREATNLDDIFSFAAHYDLAYAHLRSNYQNSKNDVTHTQNAYKHLSQSKGQIEQVVIPQLEGMQILLGAENSNSPLSNQISSKINLLQMQVNYIDNALEFIDKNMNAKDFIKIKSYQGLGNFYGAGAPKEEIAELGRFGIHQLFEVEAESPPKSVFASIIVAAMGIGQLVVGAMVAICSGGSALSMGVSLIIEGVKDIAAGVQSFIKGEDINWGEYWTGKAISFACSCIAMGWENFKAGLSAIKTQVGNIVTTTKGFLTGMSGRIMGQQAASQIGKEVAGDFTKNTVSEIVKKEAMQNSFKQTVTELTKYALTEVATSVASRAVARQMQSKIEKKNHQAAERIEAYLKTEPQSSRLQHIIAVDNYYGNYNQQDKVVKSAGRVLAPKAMQLTDLAQQLLGSVASGISAGNNNAKARIGKLIFDVANTGIGVSRALDSINSLVDDFCSELGDKIASIEDNLPDIAMMLYDKLKPRIDLSDARGIVSLLEKQGVITGKYSMNEDRLGFIGGISVMQSAPVVNGNNGNNTNQTRMPVPMILTDLSQNSNSITGINDTGDGQVTLGKWSKCQEEVMDLLRQMNKAFKPEYTGIKQQVSHKVSGMVNDRMNGMVHGGLIRPVVGFSSGLVVNKLSEVWQQRNVQKDDPYADLRITGVAAGDSPMDEIERKEDGDGINSKLIINPDLNQLNTSLPKDFNISPEVSEMINKANADKIQPIFSISTNKPLTPPNMLSSIYSELVGIPTADASVGATAIVGSNILVDGGLNLALGYGARGALSLGGTMLSSVSAPVVLIGSGLAAGLALEYSSGQRYDSDLQKYSSIAFNSNQNVTITSADYTLANMRGVFDVSNPHDLEALGRVARGIALERTGQLPQISNSTPLSNQIMSISRYGGSVERIMPIEETNSSALLKEIRMDIDPNAGKPSLETFPVHYQPKSILVTPNDSDKILQWSQLPGFMPEIRDFGNHKESFPDQSQDLDDFDMSVLYKKIDLDYGKLSKEHFDHDVRYIHGKKYEGVKITDLEPDVVDRMSELIITDKSGRVRGVHNTQDHHIVHQATDGAKELFKEVGLDIHGAENRITLPSDIQLTEHEITKMTQHVGKHNGDIVRKIEKEVDGIKKSLDRGELSKEQAKSELLERIQKHRQSLETGEQFLNSVGRK